MSTENETETKETEQFLTAKEIERAAIENKNRRIEACNIGINELLTKHKCDLEVSMLLRTGQVIPNIRIIAVDTKLQQ